MSASWHRSVVPSHFIVDQILAWRIVKTSIRNWVLTHGREKRREKLARVFDECTHEMIGRLEM
jgi:hypothetical protein